MKYIRLLLVALFLIPAGSAVAAVSVSNNEFMVAAQLLAAAKNADIQQVQALMNAGANINYVDSTGLSLVCTALMNNDIRAAQILQMYGADASNCDRQIKQYESRTKPEPSGGLFSGLSSAQTISLAAAGAAVVVGGLFLLTDWLDPGNENGGGASSGGNRPGPGGDEGDDDVTTEEITIPVGPAYFTKDGDIAYSESAYQDNLTMWGNTLKKDFDFLRPLEQPTDNYLTAGITVPLQNYLLIMHGYSAFANGYLGQETFRDKEHNPVQVMNKTGGGEPVRVSLITANGINPAGSAGRSVDGIAWALSTDAKAETKVYDKYYNYANPSGGNLGAEKSGFDLSGSGTAMNPFATANESALAKVIGGWEAGGRAYADLYGFVPNGQLSVYRTGGGKEWVDASEEIRETPVGNLYDLSTTADIAGEINPGDTIEVGGVVYKILSVSSDEALDKPDGGSSDSATSSVTRPTITIGGTKFEVGAGSPLLVGRCDMENCADVGDIAIYQGDDGYYYVNTTGGSGPDMVYDIRDGVIYQQKELVQSQVRTFEALYDAFIGDGANVLANLAVNPDSRKNSYLNTNQIEAIFAGLGNGTDDMTKFEALIDYYYKNPNQTDEDSDSGRGQGYYAGSVFGRYNSGSPILVMPAGEFEWGLGDGKNPDALDPTFENYAPALYDNRLEHLFMTVVAVQHATNSNYPLEEGTAPADSITDYGNGVEYGPLYLSQWTDTKGTETTDDDVIYMSRKCGVAGLGINGVDPWCFSAAGPTTEIAVASAAGAVAALQGAFSYMSNGEIFTLLALTADGAYLGYKDDGTRFTTDTLVEYLQDMYSLPPEYAKQNLQGKEYLKAFAEVYGYGMINLERAMTPGKRVFYYDGDEIVSGRGEFFRSASANTVFRASSAFGPGSATISAPFFDILESVNGDMSLPRVWKNEFALGVTDKRGLYMGDVLGEFTTRRDAPQRVQFGNFGFSMTVSEKEYVDNLNGLDNIRLDYTHGNWNFAAGYQRHFTDGASRFDGMSNPIFGLASNAITTDAWYNMGRWSFGARAFSGSVTDETMLDNDPTISSQYTPARLGLMQGAQSSVAWHGDKFGFNTSVGAAFESDTLLGALSGGLLDMGNGNTIYVDSEFSFSPADDVTFKLRSTFARTSAAPNGQFILGMSELNSNAFAFGVDAGNFSFSVSSPLAVADGYLQYPYAEYEIVNNGDNEYELNIVDTHIENLSLRPDNREVRFTGAYRHNFGEFTDGAIGFIYRVHPNNTDEFGNESIFMMKMTHRLGI